ncbi:hypothetical protein [Paraburkholderia fungorum]|jgi:hypothetical protein|uniref:hypothetical protein n=1 Tax=Paraburkholderia fungorum TaxID=134537 RepID=UPI000D06743F|nr:hypothetical protein [Paraburkholderia fungorum]PRZ48169.1 hypothetical protein BX589_128125 [Paraburkholderia fungorum]
MNDYELVFYNHKTHSTGWLSVEADSPEEVLELEDHLEDDEVAIGVESEDEAWRIVKYKNEVKLVPCEKWQGQV